MQEKINENWDLIKHQQLLKKRKTIKPLIETE